MFQKKLSLKPLTMAQVIKIIKEDTDLGNLKIVNLSLV
jgi:hypothetical protein